MNIYTSLAGWYTFVSKQKIIDLNIVDTNKVKAIWPGLGQINPFTPADNFSLIQNNELKSPL